ncbi:low affinity iron permease family protein [Nocardioides sp. KC13]|uniref:Low affinity iron permease family protein n=1 Tax=Nocardioides turkmenicus TaxID=2711220 RepID=A0A6M1R4Y0_9ACTN|nr:low affinity iron permease family protein [Nocardioides sp. KC13]NGN95110.1 low affinity iron permease family protein [Nocardioides sp. KC13]
MTRPEPEKPHYVRDQFSAAAHALAGIAGSAWASGISMLAVATLLISGLVTGFPTAWHSLVYATGSIVSLLVLFSIQHMTNRQTKAILLKLDELVESVDGADNDVIAMEERDLADQEHIRRRHQR